MQLPTAPMSVKTKYPERKQLKSLPSKLEELRSVIDILEPRRELEELRSVVDTLEPRHKLEELRSEINTLGPRQKVNIARYPKNQLYINCGSSTHIIFNQGLLGGIIQLYQFIKTQGDGKYTRHCDM